MIWQSIFMLRITCCLPADAGKVHCNFASITSGFSRCFSQQRHKSEFRSCHSREMHLNFYATSWCPPCKPSPWISSVTRPPQVSLQNPVLPNFWWSHWALHCSSRCDTSVSPCDTSPSPLSPQHISLFVSLSAVVFSICQYLPCSVWCRDIYPVAALHLVSLCFLIARPCASCHTHGRHSRFLAVPGRPRTSFEEQHLLNYWVIIPRLWKL